MLASDAGLASVYYALDTDCNFEYGGTFNLYAVTSIAPAYLPYSPQRVEIEVSGTVQASGVTIMCAFARNGNFSTSVFADSTFLVGSDNTIVCDAPIVDSLSEGITHFLVSVAVNDDDLEVELPIADSTVKLTYYSEPVITSVTPGAVPEGGPAQDITLRGTGFIQIPTTMQCRYGGDVVSGGRRVSDTEAICFCPSLQERAPLSVSLNANVTVQGPPGESFVDVFAIQDLSPSFLPATVSSASIAVGGRFATGVPYQCRFLFTAGGATVAAPLIVAGTLSASTDALACPATFGESLRAFFASTNATEASLTAVIATVSVAAVGGIFPGSGLTLSLHRTPRVVALTPASLYAGSQAAVLVTVESLDAILASSSSPPQLKCRFGSFEAKGARVSGLNNTITCPSPQLEPALNIRVEVSLNDGIHFTSSQPAVVLTVYRVTAIRPDFGSLVGGANLNIVGSGFRAVTDLTCTIGNYTVPAIWKTRELVHAPDITRYMLTYLN